MKASIDRRNEMVLVDKVTIEIGESRYQITETVDGKLNINKHNFYDDIMCVQPRYANEIDIT
jgi:hypothetical protein